MTPEFSSFQQNGFVLFRNIFDKNEVEALLRESIRLLQLEQDKLQGDTSYLRNNVLLRSELSRKYFFRAK